LGINTKRYWENFDLPNDEFTLIQISSVRLLESGVLRSRSRLLELRNAFNEEKSSVRKTNWGVAFALLLIFIGSLVVLPYFFKDKIMLKAKSELNKMLNANVGFSDVDMSFIRNFPYASVKLNDFHIVGKGDFEKDTLLSSQSIHLVLNVKSLFSDNGYDIRKLAFTNSI
jgi:hypothetical protein